MNSRDSFQQHSHLVFETANILHALKYKVEIEAAVAGLHLDIFAKKGRGRSATRLVVECKAYQRLVGYRTAKSFSTTVEFLRETGHATDGWLIAPTGFTQNARKVAERFSVKLATPRELREEFSVEPTHDWRPPEDSASDPGRKKRVFVIMPFTDEMDDVFLLGIRW